MLAGAAASRTAGEADHPGDSGLVLGKLATGAGNGLDALKGLRGGKVLLDHADAAADALKSVGAALRGLPPGMGDNLLKNPALRATFGTNPELIQQLAKHGPADLALLARHGDEGLQTLATYGDEGMGMLRAGVYAQIPVHDGHTINVLADGSLVQCSTCELLEQKYTKTLGRDGELRAQFDEIKNITDPAEKARRIADLDRHIYQRIKTNIQALRERIAHSAQTATKEVNVTKEGKEIVQLGKGLHDDISALLREHKDLIEEAQSLDIEEARGLTEINLFAPQGHHTFPMWMGGPEIPYGDSELINLQNILHNAAGMGGIHEVIREKWAASTFATELDVPADSAAAVKALFANPRIEDDYKELLKQEMFEMLDESYKHVLGEGDAYESALKKLIRDLGRMQF